MIFARSPIMPITRPTRWGFSLPTRFPHLNLDWRVSGLNAQPVRSAGGVSVRTASNQGNSGMASSVSFFCISAGMSRTGSRLSRRMGRMVPSTSHETRSNSSSRSADAQRPRSRFGLPLPAVPAHGPTSAAWWEVCRTPRAASALAKNAALRL